MEYGNVAQLVEQGPFKAKVPGSSPGIPTTRIHDISPPLHLKGERFFCVLSTFSYNTLEKSIINQKDIWQKETSSSDSMKLHTDT